MAVGNRKKSGKYVFTLRNIHIEEVYKNYGIRINSIGYFDEENTEPDKNTITNVDALSTANTTELITFLDEMKHPVKCIPTMINIDGNSIEKMYNIDCWWCRHPFDTRPIGCPIRYIAHQVVKTFYSEISKDKFTIREKIPKDKKDKISNLDDKSLVIKENNYYETDGVFCSFNCCKAFVQNNKHDSMYDNSNRLIIQMYNDIFNTKTTTIIPADDWKLLKDRGGGELTIEKFRENFNRISYIYHGYIKYTMRPISHLFEQKLRF